MYICRLIIIYVEIREVKNKIIMGQLIIFCFIEFFLIMFASNMAAEGHWGALTSSSLIAIILAILEAAYLIIKAIYRN